MKPICSIFLTGTSAACLTASASAASLLAYYEFEGNYNGTVGPAAAPVQNPGEVSFIAGGFRGQGADINDPAAAGGGNTGGTIDIPIDTNPGVLPGVSWGGWVNLQTNNGFTGFMATDQGGWDRGIQMQNNWGIASGGNLNNVGATTVGSWQYVVGTFQTGGNATLYVGDANAITQTTLSGARADAAASGAGTSLPFIEIGRYDNQDLDAWVDDIFVFGDELNSSEANAIRNLRLSALDFSPVLANDLFNLFDASGSGAVGGLSWSPTSGLSSTNPGEVFDMGGGQWAVVLDGAGNGLLGIPEPTVPLLGGLAAMLLLLRRRRV